MSHRYWANFWSIWVHKRVQVAIPYLDIWVHRQVPVAIPYSHMYSNFPIWDGQFKYRNKYGLPSHTQIFENINKYRSPSHTRLCTQISEYGFWRKSPNFLKCQKKFKIFNMYSSTRLLLVNLPCVPWVVRLESGLRNIDFTWR